MDKNTIIIRQPMTNLVGTVKFWTGSRWSFEYTNAKQYTERGAVKVARSFTQKPDGLRITDCEVIRDYGLDGQTKVEV